jgi:NTE family protein
MNVFLIGGGTRLAAHLGALKAIEEQRGPVGAWAGASAGSLIAAVRAAGFSHGKAVDLMLETNYRQFFDVRPLELFRGYGLCSGKRLEKWLNVILRGVRFKDLPHPLAVVCTNIETGEPVILSNTNHPNMNVATAVRCSVGIPGLFAVKRVAGAVLVDGGLTPIDESTLFPAGAERALAIRMVRDRKSQPMRTGFGWAAYIQRIASLLLDAGDDSQSAAPQTPTSLTIRTGHHSAVDFDLSPLEKQELYELGYNQAATYLRDQHAMRRPALERLLYEVDENLTRLNDLAYTA